MSTIIRGFKSEIKKTLDDPRSFKEVVEIAPCDTISSEKLFELSRIMRDVCETAFEMDDSLSSRQTTDMEQLRTRPIRESVSYYERLSAVSNLNEYLESLVIVHSKRGEVIKRLAAVLDEADSLKHEIPVYGYKVSFRERVGRGLKLEEAYYYVDSLMAFKGLYKSPMPREDYGSQYSALFSSVQKCEESVLAYLDEIRKSADKFDKAASKIKSLQK